MSRKRTAEDLISDIRHRASMEDSEFVTDDEILEYFNQERAELDWHLKLNEGQAHEYKTRDISVVAGTTTYSTPDDFWELLGAKAVIGGVSREMEPFMEAERPGLENAVLIAPYAASPRYRLIGPQIDILPSTQSFTMTLRYVPCTLRLRLGQVPSDATEGWNGYELACIYGSTAACLAKEESDPSFYIGLKDRVLRLIDALAAQRDAGHPERVTDVVGLDTVLPGFYPWK